MKIDREKIVTIDFETYWSADYTLSSPEYSTSSYIRDPQFMAHCVAIKIGSQKTKVYRGDDIAKQLKAIDWTTHAMLAQNTPFDGFICATHYGIVPCYYMDTANMTRALHNEMSRANLAAIATFYGVGEKSRTYLTPTKGLRELPDHIRRGLEAGCILDVDLCHAIAMKQLNSVPENELDLIDLTVRMFCNSPLQVNLTLARKALQEELFDKRNAVLKSGVSEDVLQSNPKFAKALQDCGVEPPQKISHKTEIHSWSFNQSDADFMALQDHEDIRVVRLIAGRLAAKSTQMETRAYRLIQAGETGGLPVGYNYYAAKTGRWGGTNKLNLHNLPRVDRDFPKPSDGLRRSIMAPKGHVLIVADSAQIEARVNAWLAGQNDLLELFRTNQDPYCAMATSIYKRPITKKDKLERFVGKTAVLGLGYGMGAEKFQTTLALGAAGPPVIMKLSDCQRIVNLYRGLNHKIVSAWNTADLMMRDMCSDKPEKNTGSRFNDLLTFKPGEIHMPNGIAMNYPSIMIGDSGELMFKSHGMVKYVYGALIIENIVQCLARIIIGIQMLWIKDYLDDVKLNTDERADVCLMTHDEIVVCAPERMADRVSKMILVKMRTAPPWCETLPLDAEVGHAINYSK